MKHKKSIDEHSKATHVLDTFFVCLLAYSFLIAELIVILLRLISSATTPESSSQW
jgi:hypothetical protein